MNRKYLKIVAEIKTAQNFNEFYSRAFSGKISPFIAALCVDSRVSPNHLTLLMIPVGAAGAFLILTGDPLYAALGSLCFIALNILDAADGELARHTKRTSLIGDYLDRVAHYITNSLFVLSIGIFLYRSTDMPIFLYVTVICEIAILTDEAIRDLLVTCGIDQVTGESKHSRKARKQKSKIIGNYVIRSVFNLFYSNVAAFHVISLLLFLSLFYRSFFVITSLYFVSFSCVSGLKLICRTFKVRAQILHC